jgi:hypothetical protein
MYLQLAETVSVVKSYKGKSNIVHFPPPLIILLSVNSILVAYMSITAKARTKMITDLEF